ncbi:MAG: hypothetical protein ACLUFP_05395 [Streptococcus salivarius]
MLHDYGFDFMKFGENAMVDLTSFSVDGKHGKKFRNQPIVLKKQVSSLSYLILHFQRLRCKK